MVGRLKLAAEEPVGISTRVPKCQSLAASVPRRTRRKCARTFRTRKCALTPAVLPGRGGRPQDQLRSKAAAASGCRKTSSYYARQRSRSRPRHVNRDCGSLIRT